MDTGLIDVSGLIEEATKLDPLPASASRIATLISSPDAEMADVCEAVRLDEALTGRLLGAANSVQSGSRVAITTVDAAVRRMGMGKVLTLALGGATSDRMRRALPKYGLSEGELWKHSVTCALAVERSPRYCKRAVRPEAFAAALLHDIGKLVLARHLDSARLEKIERIREEAGMELDEAERRVLSMGHAEVGALVARHWQLPESIALGIEHHHSPLHAPDEESRLLCSQIHLADAVAGSIGCLCSQGQVGILTPALAGSLGISTQGFVALCEDVERQLADVLESYEA